MLHVINQSNDPYFNHALEEYFLLNCEQEIFTLWINRPAILVGRNQNAYAEINLDYVKNNNIDVVRRLSGGGSVYNDLGNMNFTFISKQSEDNSFLKFAKPVIDALDSLGVKAEFSGRNDITINEKKISGNAQYYHKDKVLHHGTLLFDVNMEKLVNALNPHPLKFHNKAVKSVSSRVTNIKDYLQIDISLLDFKKHIEDYIKKSNSIVQSYHISDIEIKEIEKIASSRFRNFDWNYGKNQNFKLSNSFKSTCGTIDFKVNIKENKISQFKICGDFFGEKSIDELELRFLDCEYLITEIKQITENIEISAYIKGLTNDEFTNALLDCK